MERIKTDARRAGYVETIFGRKCFIPGIRDANPARRAGAERQAINAPLQGSAADIIKRAMGRLPAALERDGIKARMLLQVHDELLFEAPEAEIEATALLAKEVMEGACAPRCELSVPLVVETGWARSWDQAHWLFQPNDLSTEFCRAVCPGNRLILLQSTRQQLSLAFENGIGSGSQM
jgi:DNA polymerase-1